MPTFKFGNFATAIIFDNVDGNGTKFVAGIVWGREDNALTYRYNVEGTNPEADDFDLPVTAILGY